MLSLTAFRLHLCFVGGYLEYKIIPVKRVNKFSNAFCCIEIVCFNFLIPKEKYVTKEEKKKNKIIYIYILQRFRSKNWKVKTQFKMFLDIQGSCHQNKTKKADKKTNYQNVLKDFCYSRQFWLSEVLKIISLEGTKYMDLVNTFKTSNSPNQPLYQESEIAIKQSAFSHLSFMF